MKKKSLIALISLLGIILLTGGGFAVYYISESIDYNASYRSDVTARVEIGRNNDGVPQITANSIEDIYFSLGFMHAQDRLMMLEYYRAISCANLSGIPGQDAEILDRIIKVSGITRHTVELEEKLPAQYRNYLKAYINGINFIKGKNVSGIKKLNRPWNVSDVISILLLREWASSYLNNIENLFQFSDRSDRRTLSALFPKQLIYYYSRDEETKIKIIRKIKTVLEKYIGAYNKGYAFYLPANRTGSRKPLTGYSFDSSLNVYPDLYPVSIKFGEITIRGITCAGLPFIYAGNNQNISFFGFSLNTDINDFLIEKIKLIDGQLNFLSGTGWKKVIPVRVPVPDEEYRQKQDIIWETDNGPVLNDIMKNESYHDSLITLTGFYPDESYIIALMNIPFSENINKASDWVKGINSYPRVYLFTDNSTCLRIYSGRVPGVSAAGKIFHNGPGFYYRLNDITHINKSDKAEFAGSWILDRGPFSIQSRSIFDRNRIRRLEDLLSEKALFSKKDALSLLKDNYAVYAEKLIPRLLSILGTSPVTSARLSRIYFKQWDMKMDTNKVSPSLFNIIMKNFVIETYEDDIGEDADSYIRHSAYDNYNFLLDKFHELLRDGKSPVFDNRKTENVETVEMTFDRAFIKSTRYLNRRLGPIMENWKWGVIHRGHYVIPLKEESLINNLFYTEKDTPFQGGNSTLYSGAYSEDFKPKLNSSLLGIFSHGESEFHMNFSYSIRPMSKFYYGQFQGEKRIKFNKMKKTYNTIIDPVSFTSPQ